MSKEVPMLLVLGLVIGFVAGALVQKRYPDLTAHL